MVSFKAKSSNLVKVCVSLSVQYVLNLPVIILLVLFFFKYVNISSQAVALKTITEYITTYFQALGQVYKLVVVLKFESVS